VASGGHGITNGPSRGFGRIRNGVLSGSRFSSFGNTNSSFGSTYTPSRFEQQQSIRRRYCRLLQSSFNGSNRSGLSLFAVDVERSHDATFRTTDSVSFPAPAQWRKFLLGIGYDFETRRNCQRQSSFISSDRPGFYLFAVNAERSYDATFCATGSVSFPTPAQWRKCFLGISCDFETTTTSSPECKFAFRWW
jgi:hypothetical protein